jgi:hypothetical protein
MAFSPFRFFMLASAGIILAIAWICYAMQAWRGYAMLPQARMLQMLHVLQVLQMLQMLQMLSLASMAACGRGNLLCRANLARICDASASQNAADVADVAGVAGVAGVADVADVIAREYSGLRGTGNGQTALPVLPAWDVALPAGASRFGRSRGLRAHGRSAA